MFRSVPQLFIAILMLAAPAFASLQPATPEPGCPGGEYPAVGAMDLATGEVHWVVCSSVEAYRDVLGVGDVVLVQESTPERHHVMALDPIDGSQRWRRSTRFTPPSAGHVDAQGVAVLPVIDAGVPALVGIDSSTGTERWRVTSSEVPLAHGAQVTIVGQAADMSGQSPVRGLNPVTGEEVWVSEVVLSDPSGVRVGRSPVALDGGIAVVPAGETVRGIDAGTGDVIWEASHLSHLVAADGVVVGVNIAGPGSTITALDLGSGKHLWTQRGAASYGGIIAAGEGVVVVKASGTGEFVAYELATGDERWRVQPRVMVEPQLVSGRSVFTMWEGEIAVVSTTDGTSLWSATLPFGSPLMNSVGTNGEVVVVAINSRPWDD